MCFLGRWTVVWIFFEISIRTASRAYYLLQVAGFLGRYHTWEFSKKCWNRHTYLKHTKERKKGRESSYLFDHLSVCGIRKCNLQKRFWKVLGICVARKQNGRHLGQPAWLLSSCAFPHQPISRRPDQILMRLWRWFFLGSMGLRDASDRSHWWPQLFPHLRKISSSFYNRSSVKLMKDYMSVWWWV